MFRKLLKIRYIISVAVGVLFLNSVFFIVGGTLFSAKGYIEFVQNGFMPHETYNPALYLLKGLDAFMLAIIFMIFGLGIARLFIFADAPEDQIPSWLRFHEMKGLKVLLWETILVTLVIYCLQVLLTHKELSLELLIMPAAILLLAVALYVVRWKEHN
ncbi:MAG: YqhA family protein [Bacteroidales bacterium]|jgi:uncharacterized membrane protein YqhA|nr:YqhA family protein [Bacteroidales bacterium]